MSKSLILDYKPIQVLTVPESEISHKKNCNSLIDKVIIHHHE